MTPFSKVINIFLNEIRNRDFIRINNDDLQLYFNDLTLSASADFYYCKKDLNNVTVDDASNEMFFDESLDMRECNILAKYILMRYLHREIYNQDLLRQNIGDKDFKLSSNWQTLNSLISLKETTQKDIEDMRFNYQYYKLTSDDLQ